MNSHHKGSSKGFSFLLHGINQMLENVPNKQGYIKQLIRDDIARKAGTAQG